MPAPSGPQPATPSIYSCCIPTVVDFELPQWPAFLAWRRELVAEFMLDVARRVRVVRPDAILDFNHCEADTAPLVCADVQSYFDSDGVSVPSQTAAPTIAGI